MPRVRLLLSALAAAPTLIIAGCAQPAPATPAVQPSSRPPSNIRPSPAPTSPTAAPTGYACSSASIFDQPVGVPIRQQVSLGDTTAVLTGTSASDGIEPTALRDGVLTITRAGHPTVTLPVTPLAGSPLDELPLPDLFIIETQAGQASDPDGETDGSLCLSRFSDGAAPVALLALTTGGAHCCITIRAVSSDGGTAVDHAFANYPPWLRLTSAGAVLVSAEDAFADEFVSFATSGPPVQLFSWNASAFVDVTRQHLDLVAADAANYLSQYDDPSQPEKLGYLAGWVADECLLGKSAFAWAYVDQQQEAGLTGGVDYPHAQTYAARLRDFLVAQGYCPATAGNTGSLPASPAT